MDQLGGGLFLNTEIFIPVFALNSSSFNAEYDMELRLKMQEYMTEQYTIKIGYNYTIMYAISETCYPYAIPKDH